MDRATHIQNMIYDAVAQLLPSVGRDFDLQVVPGADVSKSKDGVPGRLVNTQIKFVALSPIGEAIAPFIEKGILSLMAEYNKTIDNLNLKGKQAHEALKEHNEETVKTFEGISGESIAQVAKYSIKEAQERGEKVFDPKTGEEITDIEFDTEKQDWTLTPNANDKIVEAEIVEPRKENTMEELL